MHAVSHPLLWASVAIGSLLALVVCYGIATQSIVIGSYEGRWVFRYIQPVTVRSLVVFLVVSALAIALLLAPGAAAAARRDWWLVLIWVLAALVLQALVRWLTPFTFERIFASDGANSFYGVTRHYYASTVLEEFDRVRAYWPLHAQSNMPGKLMLVYALRNLSRRPEVLAWLVVLVSNLGGVLLYVFPNLPPFRLISVE